jgi:hypothetical protein
MNNKTSQSKSIELFTFVREFARLNQKPVVSLDSYVKTFWLDQIPDEPECSLIGWMDLGGDLEEIVVDSWLSVERPELPDPPPVAEELKPWINILQWEDSSTEVPELLTKILNPHWNGDEAENEPEFLYLKDNSDLKEAWDDYIETEWWPWAENDRRKARVQECYDELFALHRTQVSFGEQYEFLLAAGCLHWCSPSGGNIKRHLLALPVRVDFDSVNAVIYVRSAESASEVYFETDMLAFQDRPTTDIEEDAEVRCSVLGDNLFHPDAKMILKSYVQGLDSQGVFNDSIEHYIGSSPQKPLIVTSPALIVRRRTSKNLITVCNNIVAQLHEGMSSKLPNVLRKIVGELGVDEAILKETQGIENDYKELDPEIYFPLDSNDEQRQILDRLAHQVCALVQGPPGTGKSQTIANLICHLLSTGNRILVTSQKAPALRVLRKKLPPEIADLCVMILGEGPDEQQELKRSVSEIANHHTNWSVRDSQHRIKRLRKDLTQARETKAKAFETLCEVREKEIFRYQALFGNYEGTLSEIAEQVSQDSETFKWFKDRLPDSINLIEQSPPPCPIEIVSAERLLELLCQIDPEVEMRSQSHLLPLDDIPTVDRFRTLIGEEERAVIKFSESKQYLGHITSNALKNLSTNELVGLYDQLEDFNGHLRRILNSESEWGLSTTKKVLSGNVAAIKALQMTSSNLLNLLEIEYLDVVDLEVDGLGEKSYRAILQDANELKSHFEKGGKCGFWMFRPSVVKQSLYLISEVTIDGRHCNTTDSLDRLVSWLQLHETIKKLNEQWSVLTTIDTEHLPLNQAIGRYRQLQTRLDAILSLAEKAKTLDSALDIYDKGIPRPWYELDEVNGLMGLISGLIAKRNLKKARIAIEEVENKLQEICLKPNSAPENQRLINAIRERKIEEYTQNHKDLTILWECRKSCQERERLQASFSRDLPELVQAISNSFQGSKWDDRVSKLDDAWNWLCADKWLSQMADPFLEESLRQQVRKARRDEAQILSQLAAEKAWQHSMESMTEGSYQGLMAWRKAIERLGKGTGKYVDRNRRLAKKRLEECRSAIPAWVMPLYKVLDTVTVKPGVFDVIIIDEASQSGPEALFLAFLAKKIVIVGDDQQIRPDNVGIDHNIVHQLQQRYLSDIPMSEIFSATESLFSIAEVRFGNPIRLREHFRCMPEIISFSNRLCYQDQPLIPLRQFGNDRLTPVLRTNYVSAAYQEKRNVNPMEADEIVSAIEKCCESPAYTGKSFGVISLLHSSDQAKEIESRLIKRLDAAEIEKRNIVCGDAYDFQGDERDIVFLSMVSARSENRRIGTMSDARAKRRFNVAVSRARDQLLLFHSVQEGELGQSCLRRRLLEHMKQPTIDPTAQLPFQLEELRQISRNNPRSKGNQPFPFGSWFEVDVYLDIIGQGYLAIPQYEVHGYRIDIVIIGGNRKMAIECDGDIWHGPEQYAEDLHRQIQLERCKWEFFRIRGSNYYRNPNAALLPLWKMLDVYDDVDQGNDVSPHELEDHTDSKIDSRVREQKDLYSQEEDTKKDDTKKKSAVASHKKDNERAPTPSRAKMEPEINNKSHLAPSSLEQVLSMTNRELGRIIYEILEDCPNKSSKKDDLTKRVCKRFDILTRGKPRKNLNKKIGWAVTHLKKKKILEEYKAKNIRVRLVRPFRQGKLF